MSESNSYLEVDWPAPKKVKAFCTTRAGGFSSDKYNSFNLALHVEDNPQKVLMNRDKLVSDLNLVNQPLWLNQVHGNLCINANDSDRDGLSRADASYSDQLQTICAVMTADCLPILLTDLQGAWVAACHAGWRGLAQGVIENTIKHYPGNTQNLLAWIGPAINQDYFEVGQEVMQQFVELEKSNQVFFKKNRNQRWQFDFIGLAKQILARLDIQTFGGDWCSYQQVEQFYSYRRDGETGRMASLIWIDE